MREAIDDLRASLKQIHVALFLGWQDVAQRYKRSKVGPFWLTLNMAVMIGALGLIFGSIFKVRWQEFLPYVSVGLILWGFISGSISEGCVAFIGASNIILQVEMPLYIHVVRIIWRNFVIFLHNLLIVPIVFLLSGTELSFGIFLSVIGLLIVIMNVSWIVLVVAIVCTRFRDVTQIVFNLLQIVFYVTPIFWTMHVLSDSEILAALRINPFFHFMSIVRSPLIGEGTTIENWLIPIAMMAVGWVTALVVFGRTRRKIAYWL